MPLCENLFIYLFISLHQGHFKCSLFSNDLLVYNISISLKVHFSPTFPLYTFLILKLFYNSGIKFSEPALDLDHLPKVRKDTELSSCVLPEEAKDSL